MRYELVVRPEAELDILEAHNWYENEEGGLGNDFLSATKEAIDRAVKSPLSFQTVLGISRRVVLKRFPYSLFFTVIDNVITLTACVHHKRHPRTWKSRL